ncbi:hypothetical protein LE181_02070 [Streptomyces sp. SCA3-4]|uniref:hypothetical protein n=1 Tax=Streptomyces sichuanensis TaxID=2871810 RepID=UPI001CE35169|nr:hypothetical protein [Streptomyces sichuanensis]MCA6090961.1 hypothetical protein [Streptomyces sichuanensis]
MRREDGYMRRVGSVVAGAVSLVVGLAGPAWAGQVDSAEAQASWADSAHISFTWADRNYFHSGRLTVSDNTCDARVAYAKVWIRLGNGQEFNLGEKYNRGECKSTITFRNVGYKNAEGIQRVWLEICRQVKWGGDQCENGKYFASNPYYRP